MNEQAQKILEDLQLGEYWYWIYLDDPLLVEAIAYGRPVRVEKIQLVTLPKADLNLEDYIDSKVEISGNITWGYAESNVFRCISIVYIN